MANRMFNKFAKVTLVLACAFLMSATLPGCKSTGKKGKCPNASASKCGKDCDKPCCDKPKCSKSGKTSKGNKPCCSKTKKS